MEQALPHPISRDMETEMDEIFESMWDEIEKEVKNIIQSELSSLSEKKKRE
jgi:hypothetical protein